MYSFAVCFSSLLLDTTNSASIATSALLSLILLFLLVLLFYLLLFCFSLPFSSFCHKSFCYCFCCQDCLFFFFCQLSWDTSSLLFLSSMSLVPLLILPLLLYLIDSKLSVSLMKFCVRWELNLTMIVLVHPFMWDKRGYYVYHGFIVLCHPP